MIPVFVQPPNQPDVASHVCNVDEGDGKRDVIAATGIDPNRVLDAKHVRGKHERWLVVAV